MKKINRLLSFLLAFVVVITTFSSDLTTAHVFATEKEAVVESGDKIATVEKEMVETPVVEETVKELTDAAADETTTEDEEEKEEASETAIDAEESETEEVEEAVTEPVDEKETSEIESEYELEFNQNVTVGDVKVSLYAAKEVLPDDAKLDVQVVSLSDSEQDKVEGQIETAINAGTDENEEIKVKEAINFDINIYADSMKSEENPEGKVQPKDGTVKVTFENISEAIESVTDSDTGLAVFHVEDDLSKVTEEAKLENTTSDEISFDAEHFSIYTVVLIENHRYSQDNYYGIPVKLVNDKGADIGNDSWDAFYLSKDYFGNYFKYSYTLAPDLDGYIYDHSEIDGKTFDYFYVVEGKIQTHKSGSRSDEFIATVSANSVIKFVYKEKPVSTRDHLDLGFTDKKEYESYVKNAKVYAIVNGKKMAMTAEGLDSDIQSYEYRLWLGNYKNSDRYGRNYCGLDEVKAEDNITFVVEYQPKDQKKVVYMKESSTEINKEASDRCIQKHAYRQNIFGFDYLFSFHEDFSIRGDVTYFSNDGRNLSFADEVTANNKNTVEYHIKDEKATTMVKDGDYYKFLGWTTVENGTTADPDYAPGNIISVKDGDYIKLYAVWEKCTLVFVSKGGSEVPSQTVNVGSTPEKPAIPTYEGYKFVDWYTDEDYTETFDFGVPLLDDTTVYAKWVADESETVAVAVYATDGTNSKGADGQVHVNEQLRGVLGLEYVQKDGYYPVGVVRLPKAMFEGNSPYIILEANLSEVQAAIEDIDTSISVLKHNNKNTVKSYLKYVQFDSSYGAGKYKTAMFDWHEPEFDGSIVNPDGGNFEYHLDLRFDTELVTYIGKSFLDGQLNDDISGELIQQGYLKNQKVVHPDMTEYEKLDYMFEGLYSDAECQTKIADELKVTEPTTIYARYVKTSVPVLNINIEAVEGGVDTKLPYNGDVQFDKVNIKIIVTADETAVNTDDSRNTETSQNPDSIAADDETSSDNEGNSSEGTWKKILEELWKHIFGLNALVVNAEEGTVTRTGEYITTDHKYEVAVEVKPGEGKNVNEDGYGSIVKSIVVKDNGKELRPDEYSINLKEGDVVSKLYITPQPVSVVAPSGLSKVVGGTDPEFKSTVSAEFSGNITKEQATTMLKEAADLVTKEGLDDAQRESGEAVGAYVVKAHGYSEKTTEKEIYGNFVLTFVPGEFKITAAPTPTPTPSSDDNNRNDDSSTSTTTSDDSTPTVATLAAAPAPAVLGAVRPVEGTGDAPAVLGARRAGTSDTSIVGSIITIIVAAGIAFAMVFMKRKNKEDK